MRPRLGYVQALACAGLFGVNAGVAKVLLEGGMEPARLTALRCTGAALGLLVVLGLTAPRRLLVPWRELPALAVLGLSGAALIQWMYFVAIDRLPVGIALLLEFTGPLLVAVYLRVVRRQQVHRKVWLALGAALAGLALVGQVWSDVGLDPLGIAAAAGAAVCLAAFYLLGEKSVQRQDPPVLTFWLFVFAALFWAIAQPWWNFDPSVLDDQTSLLGALDGMTVPVGLALLWVVVLGTLAPYALGIAALRHLTPTTTGVIGMAEPVVAASVAWIWLGQVLDRVQMVGGGLVLVAVGLVQTAQARTDPPLPGSASSAAPARATS